MTLDERVQTREAIAAEGRKSEMSSVFWGVNLLAAGVFVQASVIHTNTKYIQVPGPSNKCVWSSVVEDTCGTPIWIGPVLASVLNF